MNIPESIDVQRGCRVAHLEQGAVVIVRADNLASDKFCGLGTWTESNPNNSPCNCK